LLVERANHAVTIPLVDELHPTLLRFLLLAAGVSLPQVLEALRNPIGVPARASTPPASAFAHGAQPSSAGA
jgi:hypothetical protein